MLVHAEVVEIVIALEMPVVLADPVQFLAHERLDDRGGDIGMVVAAQRIADIVQQRHHHILLVAPVPVGARRGLQRVFEPVDRESAEIAVEQPQMIQHAVGDPAGEVPEMRRDDRPVLGRAFLHLAEFGAFGHTVGGLLGHIHCLSP